MFQLSPTKDTSKEVLFLNQLGDWQRRDVQQCSIKNYDLVYAFFCRFPSWGYPDELCECTANKTLSLILSFTPFPSKVFPRHFPSTSSLSCRSPHHQISHLLVHYFMLHFNNNFDADDLKMTLPKSFVPSFLFYYGCSVMAYELFSKLGLLKTRKHVNECPSQNSHNILFGPFSFFFLYFTLFVPVFKFTDFESPLVLFSWWRNKISWGSRKNF